MNLTHKKLAQCENSRIISTYQRQSSQNNGQSPKESKMNYQDYYTEVNAIAEALVSEAMAEHDNDAEQAMDDINDSRLHETVDGHQWIIYYNYNLHNSFRFTSFHND